MPLIRHSVSLVVMVLAAHLSFSPAFASETVKHKAKFIIALSGIPTGKMAYELVLKDGTYSFSGSGRTYGLSRIVSSAKGWTKSVGRYQSAKILAARHNVKYRSRKKHGSINIRIKSGSVISAKSVPAARVRKDAVKVEKAHLTSVLDPASASFIAVKSNQIGNGQAICNRILPIYDGKNRFDLVMKFKGTRKVVTKGFKGLSYVCAARYVPISGHRPKKKHIQRLMNNKSIEISLARIGKTSIYGLIQFSIRTKYGKVVGKPRQFKSQSL